jgi:Asp-tRNA(Asn)/Glu-tRNA(Gln) amidotransferase C subunit
MKKVSQTSADIFAERMEDVTRMFKQYEQSKVEKDET